MKPSQDTYPVFEVNQVLSSLHLNQVFGYLDEQERLTRANLIGIGIVCGLDISLDQSAGTVSITRGCGVTSQGYLIVEPDDVTLAAFKPYTLPTDPPYPPFMNGATQFDLWELMPANEPGGTLLKNSPDFLQGKAVLLFLELNKAGLRNCSLNNCDDRGSQVTITLRRLLIKRTDLDIIIAAANQLPELTGSDLEGAVLAGLNLPDLRLPRYDVPNTAPATSQDVLTAFLTVFSTEKLATKLGGALTAAYNAFLPLLQQKYPSDPFAGFGGKFGFLETAPTTTTQVRFLQYYYDLFDDLLQGYYEFRLKGIDLICACLPPDGLFPRHLMLGLLFPNEVSNPGIYRHRFLASPALGRCEDRTRDLLQLFDRLVEMIGRFTDDPPLAQPSVVSRAAVPVRITPSMLDCCAKLSEKAIPYYYLENGTPPLFQLWDPAKTRANRANQNLSYRSDEYVPPAPPFVTEALRYDLEPYNFLRIEGHLGKDYQRVLSTLLGLKSRFRLPIEIVALRTGAFNESIPVDLSKESCHFQDLEAIYDTLKAELVCFLCKEVQYFYDLPFEMRASAAGKPKLKLLVDCAPDFTVKPQTLGRLFEDWLATQATIPDIDPNIIINFLETQNVGNNIIILFYIIIYIEKLYEQLTDDLQQFNLANFEKRHQDLVSVTEAIEKEREQAAGTVEGNVNLLKWEEIDDRLEDIIFNCRLGDFKALVEELIRRIRAVKEKQFLSFFLRCHPGIQHKAGVPLGGTFVIVYHSVPRRGIIVDPVHGGINVGGIKVGGINVPGGGVKVGPSCLEQLQNPALTEAFSRISAKRNLVSDPDLRVVLGSLLGQVPDLTIEVPPPTEAGDIIDQAVEEMPEGTVIADFFLPYLCCSDCPPIQFVLPKTPLTFDVQIACTNPNNEAEVTITPAGGLPPYSVKVDDQDFKPLNGVLVLSAGPHTLVLRDQEGTESAPRAITVPARILLATPGFDCIGADSYVVTIPILGGTPPYTANRGTVNGDIYSSDALPVDTDIEIIITDSRGCTATTKVRNSCQAPLAFTMEIGCTAGEVAQVKVTATGGKPPYQAQVDQNAPAPLTDSLSLPVGTHTITVIDSAGTVTAPQTAVIPQQLRLTESDFTCGGTSNYRSFILIQGGTQPYFFNGNMIAGNVLTTDDVPSGTQLTITVTDSRNCSATIQVQHTCGPACDLPCDGESRRCAYRAWIQPPVDGAPYETYRQASPVKFTFNGENIELADAENLLQFPTQALNANFGNVMAGGIKKLNQAINDALVAKFGDAGKNRVVLTTATLTAAPFPFAVFFIEHFACETFSLEFNYTFAKPSPNFNLTVRYTSTPDFDGMILVNRSLNNKETRVPAFACAKHNLCTNTPLEQICKGPLPKPSFEAVSQGNTVLFRGNVDNPNEVTVTTWVWDILRARPTEPFYEGQEVTATLQQPGGPVRLTAITKDGCFGINERSIDIIL